jgi:hypothetical protein
MELQRFETRLGDIEDKPRTSMSYCGQQVYQQQFVQAYEYPPEATNDTGPCSEALPRNLWFTDRQMMFNGTGFFGARPPLKLHHHKLV